MDNVLGWYIDDGICASGSLEKATKCSKCVRETLVIAGLVVNKQKSLWEPVHQIQLLGFNDLDMSVLESKICRLRKTIEWVCEAEGC